MPDPSDANALRGAEFRKLTRTPKTWIWIGLAAALSLAVGIGISGVAVVGLFIAAVVTLIGIGIVFWIADHRAANAFFSSYAEQRGLTWQKGVKTLDGTSSFLRKGDSRQVNQLFTGPIADGIDGSLALYTYTVESTDSDGNRDETNYPFTVVTVKMPETVAHVKDLRVQRKSGFKALEGFEDAFRRSHERVTFESEALRDRYEIFVEKEQDQVWLRRLFSPSFIVWLTESPPKKFAFEIENGYFVAYVPKHRESTKALDEMCDVSCRVADRIRSEASETTPTGT
ncbi:MAG: hypothetical protein M9938_04720 [Solirubrobacterales bacterium]|nr:hypothetical protein [Solirubrobacterales bacterium]